MITWFIVGKDTINKVLNSIHPKLEVNKAAMNWHSSVDDNFCLLTIVTANLLKIVSLSDN